ncbi:MAG: DUF2207 domain-containing protein [Acidimicrobiales bacterium]
MAYRTRRKLDVFLLVLGAVGAGIVALIGSAAGDTERIVGYWASAEVVGTQGAVVETIDYDFGVSSRHGIFRDVPGLFSSQIPDESQVTVSSPTAPDQFQLSPTYNGTRIRIGDPNATIRGRHRYNIAYPLEFERVDGLISWNAVGTDWPVGVSGIEVHLLADRELVGPQCSKGPAGAWDGCSVRTVAPGHLVAEVSRLDAYEGVTISALPGDRLAAMPAAPTPPRGDVNDPGAGLLAAFVVAAAAAIASAAVISTRIRKRGREWVWVGGSADAAFGPQFGEQYAVKLVDHEELDAMASTEFVPPKGLTAWQGGVLYAESANANHRVAWLLERAIAGEVEIEGSGKNVTIRRNTTDSPDHEALDRLFGGRSRVSLAKYDKQFATGWTKLGSRQSSWLEDSGLWDGEGDRRKLLARIFGAVALVVGAVFVFGFAFVANRWGLPWLAGVALGALAAGSGWALVIRSWELRGRTPEGSGMWIRIESFRRFIENSDARHVEDAAKRGVLLEYTAWATALGEADHWAEVVKEAEKMGTISGSDTRAVYFATMAPSISSATSTAARAPSSSSGGGGSVGGGSGGGGGGSW